MWALDPTEDNRAIELHKFNQKTRAVSVSDVILQFVRTTVDATTVAPSFLATAEQLAGKLPLGVQLQVQSVKALQQLESVVTSIEEGVSTGVISLTNTLVLASEAVEPIKCRSAFKELLDKAQQEWNTLFDQLMAKADTEPIKKFVAKYDVELDVLACIGGWSFDKVDFLLAKEVEPEREVSHHRFK